MKYIQTGEDGRPKSYPVSSLHIGRCPCCRGTSFRNEQTDEAAFRNQRTGETEKMIFCVCETCGHILAILSSRCSEVLLGRGEWARSYGQGSPLETIRAMDRHMLRGIPVLYCMPDDKYPALLKDDLGACGADEFDMSSAHAGMSEAVSFKGRDGRGPADHASHIAIKAMKGYTGKSGRDRNMPAGFRPRRIFGSRQS